METVSLEDIMTDHVVSVVETATVGEAAHLLMRLRISGILIRKKNTQHKIVGVFTTTNLLKLLGRAMKRPRNKIQALDRFSKSPVMRYATQKITCVQKDTSIAKVIGLMHKKNIHTIPVYNKSKLVGVVGKHDILNIAFNIY